MTIFIRNILYTSVGYARKKELFCFVSHDDRLGRTAEAADAYEQAAASTTNAAEQSYLRRARDRLRSLPSGTAG